MLDPEISQFVSAVTEIYSRYPKRDELSISDARAVGEEARRRWTEGGPAMYRTEEVFAPVGDRSVRLRIYHPSPSDVAKPALVYLHGGGWVLFSIDTHDRVMREYAARSGFVTVGIDYRLAPESRFPEPVHEIADVIKWLIVNGEGLGIDIHRLVIGGDSAGANLSVAACLALREQGDGRAISGMVLNYGVFDGSFDRPSHAKYGNGEYLLTSRDMAWFWDNYIRSTADYADPLASVLRADLRGLPPAFMVITDCDVLHDENMEMADRLRQAGVSVEARVYPGTVHSFLEAVSIAKISDRAFSESARWLQQLTFHVVP